VNTVARLACFSNRTAAFRRRLAPHGRTSASRRLLLAGSASESRRERYSRPGRHRAGRTGLLQRLPNARLYYGWNTRSNGSASQTAKACQIRKASHCSRSSEVAAGLARGGASQGRFLFLRARALPDSEYERQDACFGAAAELARRQRDLDLLDRIGKSREAGLDEFDPSEKTAVAMSTEQIERVVQRENSQRAYPKPSPGRSRPGRCDCPVCRGQRGEAPDDFEEFLESIGPDGLAQAMAEILGTGMGPRPKRGRKRRRALYPPDDTPF